MIFENDLLLEVYNPDDAVLAPRTAAFAADLAVSTPAAAAVSAPLVGALRDAVTVSLVGKSLPYPKGLTSNTYMKENIGGMDCYVLRAEHSESIPTLIMFYGGGFCLNTLFAHKAFMANVAALTPCNIILPAYPLAPETKAPEIMMRSSHFLQTLLNDPVSLGFSEQIILMGWSSGGHMALTLAMNLQKEAPSLFSKIAQLILLSSWMDLSLSVARKGPYQAQQNSDTIAVGADVLEIMAYWYLPVGCKGNEAEYCPALWSADELKMLPFITVIVGSCDVLLGDSVFITDVLRRAGAAIQFIALQGQTHNYLVYDELSRDGVFVPELIGRVVEEQSVKEMAGRDGFGLTVKNFN
ncbi:MAG: esterase [Gammaproteobacteria bacterium]|jgi:acetyl esterase|nr:esterase [Gammaproteobacteria bacterium]